MFEWLKTNFLERVGDVAKRARACTREEEEKTEEDPMEIPRFDEYPFRVSPHPTKNLIRWQDCFTYEREGKDAWRLIYRYRRKGIFPVLIGHDPNGEEIVVDFRRNHHLVAGTTTYGKTNFLRQLLIELMHWNHPKYLKIAALDAKSVGFRDARSIIDVRGGYSEAKEYVLSLHDSLEKRKKLFAKKGWTWLGDAWQKRHHDAPPFIIAILDEYADFLEQAKREEGGEEVMAKVRSIMAQGASMGVQLVLATQTPMASILDGFVRNNFGRRLFFRMVEQRHWQYLSNSAMRMADYTDFMRPGDFVLRTERGLQVGRSILVEDGVFAKACKNLKDAGKDFRRKS